MAGHADGYWRIEVELPTLMMKERLADADYYLKKTADRDETIFAHKRYHQGIKLPLVVSSMLPQTSWLMI